MFGGGADGGDGPAAAAADAIGQMPPAFAERFGKFMGAFDRYSQGNGWEEEKPQGSREMGALKQLVSELQFLSTCSPVSDDSPQPQHALQQQQPQSHSQSPPPDQHSHSQSQPGVQQQPQQRPQPQGGEGGLSQAAFVHRMEAASERVAALVSALDRILDPAVRATALYIATQMIDMEEDGTGEVLSFREEAVASLATFVAAAEKWESYKGFMLLHRDKNPGMDGLGEAMRAGGLVEGYDGDDWWVLKPEGMTPQQLAASQYRVVVDLQKVAAINALDPDNLQLLSELESSGYSEEVLMRWYFHPVMGPRIREGKFLDPTSGSEFLEGVMREAEAAVREEDRARQ
ncbi:MAG: hypothetical protein WDW36_006438 [Sanguina aurantia]